MQTNREKIDRKAKQTDSKKLMDRQKFYWYDEQSYINRPMSNHIDIYDGYINRPHHKISIENIRIKT